MTIKRPESKQPIPKNAKIVFRGKIFNVYQWKQRLFDGKYATFEKIKRADSVNILPITSEGKIILTKQKQPGEKRFMGVLGGRIDADESPLGAAKRELMEESGYEAKKFILWDAVQPFSKIDWAVYTFIAKECRKTKDPKPDAGEKIELIFVTFERFLKIAASKNYRDTEIALKIFQLRQNTKEFKKMAKLFSA